MTLLPRRCARPHTRREHGFTLIELLIVVAVIGVLAAIAIPGVLKARITADEAAAIGSLKAVNSAQAAYFASGGNGGYAVRLVTLTTSCPGSPQTFLSPDLGSDPAAKSGYRIALQAATVSAAGPLDCNGLATRTAFYTTASPLAAGVSGRRAFSSGTTGVVFVNMAGTPPTEAEMAPGGGGEPIR